MAVGVRLLDIPFLNGNMFKKVIMSCTRDIVINFVKFCVDCDNEIGGHCGKGDYVNEGLLVKENFKR